MSECVEKVYESVCGERKCERQRGCTRGCLKGCIKGHLPIWRAALTTGLFIIEEAPLYSEVKEKPDDDLVVVDAPGGGVRGYLRMCTSGCMRRCMRGCMRR